MKLAALEDEGCMNYKNEMNGQRQRGYLSLKEYDQVPRTRQLTIHDIAQRFGLTRTQVKRIAQLDCSVTELPQSNTFGAIPRFICPLGDWKNPTRQNQSGGCPLD